MFSCVFAVGEVDVSTHINDFFGWLGFLFGFGLVKVINVPGLLFCQVVHRVKHYVFRCDYDELLLVLAKSNVVRFHRSLFLDTVKCCCVLSLKYAPTVYSLPFRNVINRNLSTHLIQPHVSA